MLREHRGDGHIAVLVQAELSGIEALVTHTATHRGFQVDAAKTLRMWSDEQWSGAEDSLRDRGLLDASGELTPAGTALRQHIETETDRLCSAPWRDIDPSEVDALIAYGKKLTRAAVSAGAFPERVFAN